MSDQENDPKKDNENQDGNKESAGASVSTWLSGWYDTAKKKLAETNEFMKHDLQEFSQSVQDDASRLVAVTATTMKEKLNINVDLDEASTATRAVKDSLSNLLGNIANKVGPIRPDTDENDDESVIVGTSSGSKVLSPSEARLFAIQTDPATFCNEPDEDQFYGWLPSFNVEGKKQEISTLMLDVSQIRALYTKLVPSAVSHSDFWARYFFKIHQHKKAEEKRAMLVERAHQTHSDIEWDDEDDDWVQPKNIPLDIAIETSLEPAGMVPTTSDQLESEKSVTSQELVDTATKMENSQELTAVSLEESHKKGTSDKMLLKQDELSETAQPASTKNLTATCEHSELNNIDTVKDTTEAANAVEGSDPKKRDASSSKEQEAKVPENKTPSSGESSDDWEKDFDLDMTEDEIQQALKESDAINADDIDEDWDDWE